MNRRSTFTLSFVFVLATSGLARADAGADLAAGKQALQQSQLDKALPLLLSAAEALPKSVEAQLALSENYLRLGNVGKALQQYHAVLKLSPDHAHAKRMVMTLTGNQTSFESRLSTVQALIAFQQFTQALDVIKTMKSDTITRSQRNTVQLLSAECQLWNRSANEALRSALQIVKEDESDANVKQARVIAALAMVRLGKQDQVADLIAQAGELNELWASRATVATVLSQLDDEERAAELSSKLVGTLSKLPSSDYLRSAVSIAHGSLSSAASSLVKKGDIDAAMKIVWPMISSGELPADQSKFQPFDLSGGWVMSRKAAGKYRRDVGKILSDTGRAEFARDGERANLFGYWLAAEVLRQSPRSEVDSVAETLALITDLEQVSQAPKVRKTGDVLSRAAHLQRQLIISLVDQVLTADQQKQLVNQLLAHIGRYEAASDLKTGLAQFVTVNAEAEPPKIQFAGSLDKLPRGTAHQSMLYGIAALYAKLGQQEFAESTSAVVVIERAVNVFDKSALILFEQIGSHYPTNAAYRPAANAIVTRYADAGHWDQAAEAINLSHPASDYERRWAIVRLRIRQATTTEDKLLAARRALGAELSARIKANLEEAAEIVQQDAHDSNRKAAIQIANSLVARYESLDRPDLSDLIIATVTPDEDSNLLDWGLWARANLIHMRASKALSIAAAQTDTPDQLTLLDLHKSEIELLNQIVSDHTKSEFASNAVARILQISGAYQTYRAFDTAQAVLTDFLKSQPKLAAAESFEYNIVRISLATATGAFNQRENKSKSPAELLPEHVAAIGALSEFLKKHPTGEFSRAAEDELFAVARLYGSVGGWNVARTVLTRFTEAIPNFRSPGHLKLLQAATYLGELDRSHGLGLLSPAPATKSTSAGTALAANENSPGEATTGSIPTDAVTKTDASKVPYAYGGGAFIPPQGAVSGPAPLIASAKPSESSLAMIRQSQQRQFQRIAMLEAPAGKGEGRRERNDEKKGNATVLPSGIIVSKAEKKRQDDAADKAYAILIELIKSKPFDQSIKSQARGQVLWLFAFFENQLRADRAIALIKRYLGDHPTDHERVSLAYRSLTDQIVWVRQRKPNETIDQRWIDERHELFVKARQDIAEFIKVNSNKKQWIHAAHLLAVDSFQQEAQLVKAISSERAGGLLVQCAHAIVTLLDTAPEHPQTSSFANRIWALADQISALGQNEQAVYVLRQLTLKFPTHQLANQSLVRIANLYAANLTNPLRAVETYQEYLNRTTGDPSVPAQIYQIAGQLAAQKRYLEAIHVYGVFVDSFPSDANAAVALHAIGKTHQSNEAWQDAIATYERIIEEYPSGNVIPQVKLDVAECRINLGEWAEARELYEQFLEQFARHPQASTATARLEVLKKLDRFQDLLADNEIDRNKDDAQFQIGRTAQLELQNPVKAIEEFRKVVTNYAASDLADDAQVEIGRALLSLNRMEEGREQLLKVPSTYPNSPLADDALFLIGQSYEQNAQRLAGVTAAKTRETQYVMEQKDAYRRFNKSLALESARLSQRRDQLKQVGDKQQLALNEALDASRAGSVVIGKLYCEVTQAELETETETALQLANRQDRINDSYREAIDMYLKAATDYPLGDKTDQSLIRIAEIFETQLKDRPAAMQTYQKIVKLFPGTPVAEDAAWKVAQFYVEEGKYTLAADSFKTFIRNYPSSPRVADAQFGMAEVLEQLGKWVDAMDAYEVFRQKFGKHPKVKLAMEQISWIKTYRK